MEQSNSNSSENLLNGIDGGELKNEVQGEYINKGSSVDDDLFYVNDDSRTVAYPSNSAANSLKINTNSGFLNGNANSQLVANDLVCSHPADYATIFSGGYLGTTADREGKTFELKLIDGSMVVETFSFSDIKSIQELEKDGRRFTHVRFKRYFGEEIVELDVDCKMTAFMRIIGKKYVPWHKTIMEMSVKDGEEV